MGASSAYKQAQEHQRHDKNEFEHNHMYWYGRFR